MKKFFRFLLSFLITNLVIIESVFAFNPHLIITDEELTDFERLDRDEIDAFLRYHDSGLVGRMFVDENGQSKTAAELISQSAKKYQINPAYILTTLQKEQSVITAKNPTDKQLDWAAGYGACDACSLNDPKVAKYKGFAKQVDASAGIMRWYYENLIKEPWIRRLGEAYIISNEIVKPESYATGFLYTYTPHIHGNRLFHNIWNSWFRPSYPDGTIVKSADSPTVYLIKDGQRRPFTNLAALKTRFEERQIVTVEKRTLEAYRLGTSISLPNYSIITDGPNHYLLDDDILRPFKDAETFRYFGYHPDEVITLNQFELESFDRGQVIEKTDGSPLGRVVRLKENNNLYFIKDGSYYLIPSESVRAHNYSYLPIESINIEDLSGLAIEMPKNLKDGTIFGIINLPEIFVVDKGKKRHIADEESFHALGYKFDSVVWVDEVTASLHPSGEPLKLTFYKENIIDQKSEQKLIDNFVDL